MKEITRTLMIRQIWFYIRNIHMRMFSTLLKLIKGLLKNQTGEIHIDGKLEDIGYIFQYPEHQIFETTIFKDVSFGLKKLKLSEKDLTERVEKDRKSTRLNSSHITRSRMPSSA